METPKTIAESIARALGDDGRNFETKDGHTLSDLCEMADGLLSVRGANTERVEFHDDSRLIIRGDAWDLGVTGASGECYCWPEANHGAHAEDCPDA